MTRRHPATGDTPRDIGSGETRSQFLLARKQAAAHVSTAHYGRLREMGGWALVARRQRPPSAGA